MPVMAELPLEEIRGLCETHGVAELSIFGSFLRDDFDPASSDIDVLVDFHDNNYGPWLHRLNDLEEALGALLGCKVDVVPKQSVIKSRNYIRRHHILKDAQRVFPD